MILPADDVILAIGQENAFPWIERDAGIEFDKDGMPVVDPVTMQSTRPGVFFGGDSAFGPKNIIWAVAHAHEAAISIHNHCSGMPVTERPPQGMNLITQKMGLAEWSYSNDYNPAKRAKMKHVDLRERFAKLALEVELGFDPEQTAREVERCLNCDIQTVFTDAKCIECDACIDVCPTTCLTIAPNGEEDELRKRLTVAGRQQDQDAVRVGRAAANRAGDGQGRGRLRPLRPVRRALPDGGVGHAEVRSQASRTRARG